MKTPRRKMPCSERSPSLLRTSPVGGKERGRERGREGRKEVAAAAAAAEDQRSWSGDARSSRRMRIARAAAWEELRDPPLLSA